MAPENERPAGREAGTPAPGASSTVGEEPTADDAADEIVHELDELGRAQAERDEYLDSLRRVQADFENYRKRVLREQTALVERATEGLVEALLPVLDSFELALTSAEEATEGEEEELAKVRKGVELVYAELLGALEKAGLSRIEATGKPFDPTEHEAVAQDAGDADGDGEPVVSEVLRTGYRLRGRVLRPAMVKVTR